MALFGAPVALEDHAFRACLAALAIQEEANRLAAEVARRDGVELRLRVGLNSGQVIAGEIGSGSLGYAAIGETVGFAQRMESVAPPGGVMLSESTARLVEHLVTLAEPEWVRIKGVDEPVRARRLMGIGPRDGRLGRAEAGLVGRRWEMAAIDAMVDRAIAWPRWRRECGGTAGHRQEPGGPRGRRTGGRTRRRSVVDHLRVPRSRHPVLCGIAAAASGQRRRRPRGRSRARTVAHRCAARRRPRGSAAARRSARRRRPRCAAASDRPGCAPAPVDRADQYHFAVAHRAGAFHHRGCALDRCGQRVDAGRPPHRHYAHPVDGADHIAPRVRRSAVAGARCPGHSACPTG